MLFSHRNQVKRNRNSGTKKSGYKKQSEFNIPSQNRKPFYQNINIYEQCQRNINSIKLKFIIEKLKPNYLYACNIDEICEVLSFCPTADLEGLGLIILRQPKRKEEIFSPCWGRLIYEFDYQEKLQPAIILEAVNIDDDIVINNYSISPFFQKEIALLIAEGHEVKITKRRIVIKKTIQAVKQTQLYRTVLHEVGHYVYKKSAYYCDSYEEKENFANAYAENIRELLLTHTN